LADDGGDLQAQLLQMTGQRTVPSVWIKGQHVGGCDGEPHAAIASSFMDATIMRDDSDTDHTDTSLKSPCNDLLPSCRQTR